MVHTFKLYLLMIKWQLLNMKEYLPLIVLVQIIIGVGVVYGLGFMYPDIDSLSAKYITTGATMMSLATLGLALVPQSVAQMKANKTFDYLWSLPVPRLVFLLSDFTLWTAVVLPGVLLALVFGSLKYGFDLSISPLAFPAFVMVALTAVSVGMSLAHLSPSPVADGRRDQCDILIAVPVLTGELPDRPPARRTVSYSHGVAGQVHGRAGARDGHDGSG